MDMALTNLPLGFGGVTSSTGPKQTVGFTLDNPFIATHSPDLVPTFDSEQNRSWNLGELAWRLFTVVQAQRAVTKAYKL